jgi:hypothetical protein
VSYVLPTVSDFKSQFSVRDFPYAVLPNAKGGGSGASATAIVGGSQSGISSWDLTSGGTGYPANKAPDGIVQYGGGHGAAVAIVVAGGSVTQVNAVLEGYGYILQGSQAPQLYISNGTGDNTDTEKVTDFDIAAAQQKATGFNMTQTLFSSQAAFTVAYGLLAAHYLCETLLASGTGLLGKAEWLTANKAVGNVSEGYVIPERVSRSPILSKLSKTTYGSQFLELISPQLIGNFQARGLFRAGRP